MNKVLFVDDDRRHASMFIDCLVASGFEVVSASGPDQALAGLKKQSFSFVVTDIMMDPGKAFTRQQTSDGKLTGFALAKTIKARYPQVKVVALSNFRGADIQRVLLARSADNPFDKFLSKMETMPSALPFILQRLTSHEPLRGLRTFIVHGHNKSLLLETKNFLQNRLGLPEPVILAERPSSGRTVIEKFEHFAKETDAVFVLMTPDDIGRAAKQTASNQRARQNVIFELGYFLGSLNRLTGRVILLHKGRLELPSDIAGIVYLDISDGIEVAAEQIRAELYALCEKRTA